MSLRYALGVDVGGTKIALAIVDENLRVTDRMEVDSHASDGFELWDRIASATTQIVQQSKFELSGIGIGSAGPIYPELGTISPVNIPIWRNFPIVQCFKNITLMENIDLQGDVMALAYAEHVAGAGIGSQNMLGMVVSTGIGGGLIIDGQPFSGETGNASYLGHSSVNFDGVLCACGRKGCIEAYASGPSMVAKAKELGWQSQSFSFVDLATAARNGIAPAVAAIEIGTKALAVGIVNFVESLDISTVVIGGGVALAGDVYWEPLLRHVNAEANYSGFLENLKVLPAKLKGDAGLIGAALSVIK